jgi:hypothetical protein
MDNSDDQKSFFKHVFNFDDDSKSELLNIIQYAILAIIPVIVLNKTMSKYIPEADEQKGSLEISAEIIIQIIVMFIGLMLIHRIITYVPTYSGEKYPNFSIIFIILAILLITLSLQTKLGEKVSILFERITELWEGKSNNKNTKNNKNNVKVSQPISGQQITNQGAINQSIYSDGTSINSLPITQNASNTTQQLPNYNNMYQQDTTPLVNAATPGMTESFEPMAANSALGGGFGSSW